MSIWQTEGVARVTRAESKERTRQRPLAEAQRLFRERGYAATSLEQIAEAAEVTKGAIYGHFASKDDLMLSALEAAPAPDYSTTLNDQSRPLPERLARFSRAVDSEDPGHRGAGGVPGVLRRAAARPEALHRYSSGRERRRQELADADSADGDELAARVTPAQAWAIGQAMLVGLQILQALGPRPIHAGGVRARIRPAGLPLPGAVRTARSHQVAGCGGGIPAVSLAG